MTQPRPQITQTTKNGSLETGLKKSHEEKIQAEPTREELSAFYSAIHQAQTDRSLAIDADRSMLEHFNRGKMTTVDETGYFIYQDVKVFERGKREDALRRDALTSDERVFEGKK